MLSRFSTTKSVALDREDTFRTGNVKIDNLLREYD